MSEESLGLSVRNVISYLLVFFIVFIIPALIILAVIKGKGRLASLTLKKTLGGTGLLFLVLVVIGVAGSMSMTDEEKVKEDVIRKIDDAREKQIQLGKEALKQKQKYAEPRKVLDNYLKDLAIANLECNKVPNSVKFTYGLENEINEIIINSALMVILIEETPKDSGLWPYKQRIITNVDKLSECLNRH